MCAQMLGWSYPVLSVSAVKKAKCTNTQCSLCRLGNDTVFLGLPQLASEAIQQPASLYKEHWQSWI